MPNPNEPLDIAKIETLYDGAPKPPIFTEMREDAPPFRVERNRARNSPIRIGTLV